MLKQILNRLFSKNKGKLIIIGVIVLMLVVYLLAVYGLKMEKQEKENQDINEITSTYKPRETVIEGKDVKKEEFNKDDEIVKQFVNYCSNKEYENAYNLLSDECKSNLYPQLSSFERTYARTIFATPKLYSLESWINNGDYVTYRISYTENPLVTGDYTHSEKYLDYITVVNLNGTRKISLKEFVGEEKIFKTIETDELTLVVETRVVYLNKVEYNLQVTNKTNDNIKLDGFKNRQGSIVLTTDSGNYKNHMDESYREAFDIEAKLTNKIKLQFNVAYDSGEFDRKIEFSDVVLNVQKYRENKTNYPSSKITIKL